MNIDYPQRVLSLSESSINGHSYQFSEIPYELIMKIFTLLRLPDIRGLALCNKKFSTVFLDVNFWLDQAIKAKIYDSTSSFSPLEQLKYKIHLGILIVDIKESKIIFLKTKLNAERYIPKCKKALEYFPKNFYIELFEDSLFFCHTFIYYDRYGNIKHKVFDYDENTKDYIMTKIFNIKTVQRPIKLVNFF